MIYIYSLYSNENVIYYSKWMFKLHIMFKHLLLINLSYVLKILTLINNDRITLPEQVSLLFEVEDLVVASPATVSRAGMVYNDYKDFGWRPYVDSWLQKYDNQPEFVEEVI